MWKVKLLAVPSLTAFIQCLSCENELGGRQQAPKSWSPRLERLTAGMGSSGGGSQPPPATGSVISSPSGVRGGDSASEKFSCILEAPNGAGWANDYIQAVSVHALHPRRTSTTIPVRLAVSAKFCRIHHCRRWFQYCRSIEGVKCEFTHNWATLLNASLAKSCEPSQMTSYGQVVDSVLSTWHWHNRYHQLPTCHVSYLDTAIFELHRYLSYNARTWQLCRSALRISTCCWKWDESSSVMGTVN